MGAATHAAVHTQAPGRAGEMSVEVRADDAEIVPADPAGPAAPEPLDRRRPNVSGDLRTVFQVAPTFRRAVGGYDRFQVDTYVQWAEEELAGAGRTRDDLLARYARLRADLDEARRLLSHSVGGQESVRLSYRIGSMLAAAADQADDMRAEAEEQRAAACAEAERLLAEASAEAERLVADASAEAQRLLAEASAQAERRVAEGEEIAREARAEADARLEKVGDMQRRATEDAARVRQEATRDATVARMQARDEVVRVLTAGREERRRADEQAAAMRDRLDRDAAARRAALLAEVEELEQRHAVARAGLDQISELVTESLVALEDLPDPVLAGPVRAEPAAVPVPRDAAAPGGESRTEGRRAADVLHFGRRHRRG